VRPGHGLEGRAKRLVRAYRNLGVRQDSFATIRLPNGRVFEAVIAVRKLGATPQPISSPAAPRPSAAQSSTSKPSLTVGVEPSETTGRTTIPVGFEPDTSLSSEPLPPVVAASFKAPTSGGNASTGPDSLVTTGWDAR
jgi:bile acid-coenzyme A ligase